MAYRASKSIVMIGLMGAGKTALGGLLSEELGLAFLDSDNEIETAANASIAEIFARDGEAFFRLKEAQVIERLLEGPPVVLSVGGGAYIQERVRRAITERGVAVWLDVPLDILWERVKKSGHRPLLANEDPYATLAELFEQRRPIYEQAEIHVTTEPGIAKEAMTARILETLLSHPKSGLSKKEAAR